MIPKFPKYPNDPRTFAEKYLPAPTTDNIVTIGLILLVLTYLVIRWTGWHPRFETSAEPDEHTKQLCREWAAADHSGAVPKERYEWYGEENWKNFDWYGSCLLNNNPGRFTHAEK